ncbi:MAG: hypothetical protein BGP01_04430 [Paludibacter sp. 47-17]|nr:MAG: hypothetical protein BGP01_04430 [Paludibacter sp. 47-17]
MRRIFILFLSILGLMGTIHAQVMVRGKVVSSDSQQPLPGVSVTLMQQDITALTNGSGEFTLEASAPGLVEIRFVKNGYFTQIREYQLSATSVNVIPDVALRIDINTEVKQEIVLQLSEMSLNTDDDGRDQNISTTLSNRDVYISQASFSFSPMRFRMRGYDNNYETTYINGVHFNSLERGGFNYSALGGLNDAMRNRENVYGLQSSSFSFGNLGGVSNINTRASAYAAGVRSSIAFTNRAYRYRAQATYATGLRPDGWAFTASGVVRWANEGIVDGTFYNSGGYFLSAEKVFNPKHSLSLVTFGAPTQRAQGSATTQEVYDLAGSIYYNSYWGYQDGKKRNSRIVKSFDPTVILSHDFKIDDQKRLRTGLAYHYSLYSNSALTFYNAPDPRPDYYRELPSFWGADTEAGKYIAGEWQNNPSIRQIDWAELYLENAKNKDGNAKYAVERRHNNLSELAFNSTFTNEISKKFRLTAGVEFKKSKGMHYKTMEDLLGAGQWVDIDQFAERDFPTNPNIIQNDVRNPNRIIREGDIFGYNYDINLTHANVFIQNEWNFDRLEVHYAAKMTYTEFYRFGHMENGRAVAVGAQSYGKGKTWWSLDPSIKGGLTYKFDGRNRIMVNAMRESRAPLSTNSYVSQRIKDSAIPMRPEEITSFDAGYAFTFPGVRGRISGFHTEIMNAVDMLGYYDDEYRTFINHTLTQANKRYMGVEAGLSVVLNTSFTVSMAGTLADYTYTNNAMGIKSPENGSFADVYETVMTKGLYLSNGPQLAANITLDYFHPKMWFADITLNYFDKNYLDFAPNRFTEDNRMKYTTQQMIDALGTQERLQGGFLLDASIGKLIYLPQRRSLNVNLSMSNILNNQKMITGGFQQARLPLVDGAIDAGNLNRFPNKYYYAWGFNMFLNIGYRF